MCYPMGVRYPVRCSPIGAHSLAPCTPIGSHSWKEWDACALNSEDYESNRLTERWNHSRLQKTRHVRRKGGFVLSARRPGLLYGRWQCDLRKLLLWLQSLRNLKLNIASRWEASAMLRMFLGVGLSTPSSPKPEASRNLRRSAREPKLLKTSAPLSTAWRWRTKPLEECQRKSRKKRDES